MRQVGDGTDGIELVEVEPGGRLMERFLALPAKLNRADPAWITPLRTEGRATVSRRRNPWFEHGEAAFWLARRGGRDIGRISAQRDTLVEANDAREGHFGLLASVNDPAVVWALVSRAEAWLRARGAGRAVGPYSLSINQQCGLLVDGFTTPPKVMMGHDPPYLGGLLEEAGYRKEKDLLAFLLQTPDELPAAMGRRARRPLPAGVTLRPLSKARYAEDIRVATTLFNDAWAENWGFVPLTEAEMDSMATRMRPLIRERLVWFACHEGEPFAFIVCLPDVNEAARGLDGRLVPFGWAKLLWRLARGTRGARIPLMGVRRAQQASLLGPLALVHLMEALRRECASRCIREVEISWVLEDNAPMRRLAVALGGVPYKTYRLYSKDL